MSSDQLLARLMAQSEARGVDLITLRALAEEASQAGASRALGALGLDDPRARRDMDLKGRGECVSRAVIGRAAS